MLVAHNKCYFFITNCCLTEKESIWMVELFAGKLLLVSRKPQLLTRMKSDYIRWSRINACCF